MPKQVIDAIRNKDPRDDRQLVERTHSPSKRWRGHFRNIQGRQDGSASYSKSPDKAGGDDEGEAGCHPSSHRGHSKKQCHPKENSSAAIEVSNPPRENRTNGATEQK